MGTLAAPSENSACHFHLPSRSPGYLEQFWEAREAAGVELWNLLIDDGDIIHPEHAERDCDWVVEWADTAAELGAKLPCWRRNAERTWWSPIVITKRQRK